jgi:hypothetical protein
LLFVGADGFLAFIFGHGALPRLHDLCAQTWPAAPLDAEKFRSGFCATIDATPVAIGVAVGSLSLMLLAPQFVRGLKDSGFVAPTFLAERRRRSGI